MRNSGLCSVSFRSLGYQEIISYAKKFGIDCIEWGSDVHAKESDLETVKKIKEESLKNSIKCESYGTYFRLENVDKFKEYLNAAKVLGVKVMRIWSGVKSSSDLTSEEYFNLVDLARQCGKLAFKEGIIVAFEYHVSTLTDNPSSTLKFLSDINLSNVKTYWQPMYWSKNTLEENIGSIKILKEKIVNVHVYEWDKNKNRYDLHAGMNLWREYLKHLNEGNFYLEFFKDNSLEQFEKDAKTLKELLRG